MDKKTDNNGYQRKGMPGRYDPYVQSVKKEVKVRLVTGKNIFGRLLQSSEGAIALQLKKSNKRMVIEKSSIRFVTEEELKQKVKQAKG